MAREQPAGQHDGGGSVAGGTALERGLLRATANRPAGVGADRLHVRPDEASVPAGAVVVSCFSARPVAVDDRPAGLRSGRMVCPDRARLGRAAAVLLADLARGQRELGVRSRRRSATAAPAAGLPGAGDDRLPAVHLLAYPFPAVERLWVAVHRNSQPLNPSTLSRGGRMIEEASAFSPIASPEKAPASSLS